MKRNPKTQLLALIRGLRLEEGLPMEDLMEKGPDYYEKVGADFVRLANIGMAELNRMEAMRLDGSDYFRNTKLRFLKEILMEPQTSRDYRKNIEKILENFESLIRDNAKV